MLTSIFLVIGGFFLLVQGAKRLVDGSASLARRLGVRSLVIGLTVVAFGTSAPELVVNLVSAARGQTDIAIANVLGSNIANVLLILGLTSTFASVQVQRSTIWKEIPFSLLAAVLVVILGSDRILDGHSGNALTFGDGLVLLSFFLIFLYYVVGVSRTNGEQGDQVAVLSKPRTAFFILGGLAALVVGGTFIVDGAVSLARLWGVSEHLIGLTVVAVGTSLPELATSVVAARKKNIDLAVGNIVGSNIFNVFFILGTTALFAPLSYGPFALQDAAMAALASFILFLSMFVGKPHQIDRWEGAAYVLLYLAYVSFTILRG